MPGGEMNGMVVIANKPGGYSEEDIEFLEVSGAFTSFLLVSRSGTVKLTP